MSEPAEAPRADVFVTLVTVVGAENTGVDAYLRAAHATLSSRYANYELVVVDNGLTGSQLADVRPVLDELACIRVLRLSRRFAVDTAVFAGLESAIGDYVVVASVAHDPVDVIPEVVALNRGGADVVQGLSAVPIGGSLGTRIGRRGFYWYNRRFLGIDIPQRATFLTGLTRRAVNSLTASARNHRYLRHLIRHVGYRPVDFEYTPVEGRSRQRTIKSGWTEAVEMISSYSTHPLRVITVLGVIAGFFNLAYAVYVVIVRLVLSTVAEGWTTTSLQLSLMFFIISIIIAVQSEYIGRILTETRREPSYFIVEELESETLIADIQRRNVSS